ncbi:MAG: TatD family hydrolase [Niabella sp.]
MYIDTHSHVYSKTFSQDTEIMLQRAQEARVTRILMPAIDMETHKRMLQLESNHPETCISMMGLHPCSVNETLDEELATIEAYLQQRKFVAIGETGLDFYWDRTFEKQQYLSLEKHIEWALQYDLPIVLHTRNATDECVELVKKYTPAGLRGVFHCFGGTIAQAETITTEGFYLGIGGVLTFKKSGLDEVLRQLPLDYVVLETDAPYLAPVPYRGKRNESAYIPYVAEKLAEVKGLSIEEVAKITTGNAENLFRIKG